MTRALCTALLSGFLTTTAAAQADPPEPFLLLEVSGDCATAEEDDHLLNAIELRIPNAFVVRGAVEDVQPDWRVTWRPATDETCELVFSSADTSSAMTLGPHPGIDEIQLAASRVAWLASVAPSRRRVPGGQREEGEEGEEEEGEGEEEKKEEEEKGGEEGEEGEEEAEAEEEGGEEKAEAKAEAEAEAEAEAIPGKLGLVPGVVLHPRPLPERAEPRFSLNLIGGSNYALRGFEIGLLWNHTATEASGLQLALGANIVDGGAKIIQLALVNQVRGDLRGLQAGLLNIGGEVKAGAQLGLLNLAGPVNGTQIGVANVAESSDLSIGLLNIMYGEPLYLTTWLSQTGLTAGIQHGSRFLRWAYLGGYDPFTPLPSWKAGLGLVGHFGRDALYLDLDALLFVVVPAGEPIFMLSQLMELKFSVGRQFARRFALFGGGSVKLLYTGLTNGADLAPTYAFQATGPALGTSIHGWPELHLGVRF